MGTPDTAPPLPLDGYETDEMQHNRLLEERNEILREQNRLLTHIFDAIIMVGDKL